MISAWWLLLAFLFGVLFGFLFAALLTINELTKDLHDEEDR